MTSRTRCRSCRTWTLIARPTGSPSRPPARPTPRNSWPATGPRSATASLASTPSPGGTWPGRLKHAPPSATSGNPLDRRRSLAPRIITVFRTDADPRTVDLSLDPSERPYGSLFGKRPDLINYGLTGFGRLTTPEAWLSTWSGLSSNADFVRCAPGVTVPTLFIELTGDQAAFPADSRRMTGALGATDLTTATVRGLHFGGPIAKGEPTGNELAAAEIIAWLAKRHELTPPA